MKRLRLAAALLCALLMLSLPVMADGFGMGDFDSDTVNKNPQVDNPNEVTPTSSTEPPQEPTGDGAGNNTGNTGSPLTSWMTACGAIGITRAISRYGGALQSAAGAGGGPPGAGAKTAAAGGSLPGGGAGKCRPAGGRGKAEKARRQQGGRCRPTELVLPQREARTGSPVRYILIGALLAGALCIAIYLFTHPAREDDPADETKS